VVKRVANLLGANPWFNIGNGSFNPEPAATVFFSGFAAVAIGSGLNKRKN
jgi:hypothetical protein